MYKYIIIFLLIILLFGCTKKTYVILKQNPISINTENITTTEKTLIEPSAKFNINSYEKRSDGAVRITDSTSAQNPAFSQDGIKILFTKFKSGYNEGSSDLKILNLETGNVNTLLGDGNSNVNLPGSSWIGDDIVYSSTKDPHDEIYTINTVSKKISKITSRNNLVAYEPSFSPNKKKIVFESHVLDVEEDGIIFIYDIGKNSYTQITAKNEDARQPNWSPKGDLILYQKFQNNRWDIWIYNLSSEKEFRLTQGSGDKTDASFSPGE